MYPIQLYWSLCNKWSLSFQSTTATSNGVSDFQKKVITVMTMSFKEHSPIERHYRDFKYFDQNKFEMLVLLTMNHLKLLSLKCWTNIPHYKRNSLELIRPYSWQKPWGKLLWVDLNLRQYISKLKLKPNSNYTKKEKTIVRSYTKGEEENIMSC